MGHKKVKRIAPLEQALPFGGVDSHAHLDGDDFDENRREIFETATRAGISKIGNVFLSPEDYIGRKSKFADFPRVFFLLGIHPCDGLSFNDECLEKIVNCFKNDARLKAVGEIGLDYHWDDCPRDLQRQVFARQLQMAREIEKPVVIHCRDAENDCLALLEASGFKNYPLLWHCFGGNRELAERIIGNGWHISVPGSVTYPANAAMREAMPAIPEDRLLLETDCPYLPPVPWRGALNQPAYLVFTARAVAEARNEDAEKLWLQSGVNACSFFGLQSVD